jgi:hypothetical protein
MLSFALSVALIIQLAGCGTIIYPERRGQASGRIDIGIAILDAVGLFFFIIPGLIAFGVDFTTGTIYLPGGRHRSGSPHGGEMTVIRVNPRDLNSQMIEDTVTKYAGVSERICLSHAEAYALDNQDTITTKLAELIGFRMAQADSF